VLIVNWAVVEPAGTVTALEDTVATAVLLLAMFTTVPPAGADPVRVMVAVEVLPPTTDAGFSPIELSAGGFTVRPAVRELDR
jgi:hypothetical protein